MPAGYLRYLHDVSDSDEEAPYELSTQFRGFADSSLADDIINSQLIKYARFYHVRLQRFENENEIQLHYIAFEMITKSLGKESTLESEVYYGDVRGLIDLICREGHDARGEQICDLRKELNRLDKTKDVPFDVFIKDLKTMFEQMKTLGQPIDKTQQLQYLLAAIKSDNRYSRRRRELLKEYGVNFSYAVAELKLEAKSLRDLQIYKPSRRQLEEKAKKEKERKHREEAKAKAAKAEAHAAAAAANAEGNKRKKKNKKGRTQKGDQENDDDRKERPNFTFRVPGVCDLLLNLGKCERSKCSFKHPSDRDVKYILKSLEKVTGPKDADKKDEEKHSERKPRNGREANAVRAASGNAPTASVRECYQWIDEGKCYKNAVKKRLPAHPP